MTVSTYPFRALDSTALSQVFDWSVPATNALAPHSGRATDADELNPIPTAFMPYAVRTSQLDIVSIEAHPVMRLGLAQLLSAMAAAVVGRRRCSIEAGVQMHGAELLIYGLALDTNDEWNYLEYLHQSLRPRHILTLNENTWLNEPAFLGRNLPIRGNLPKHSSIGLIEAAIRLVLAGGHCFSATRSTLEGAHNGSTKGCGFSAPLPKDKVPENSRACRDADLLNITPRQYEVLTLLARGYPIKIISRNLNISLSTAKAHACQLYQRLHVRNRGEAVYAARLLGVQLN